MSILVGFDYETHLFGPENLAPKPVCLSAYINDEPTARSVGELEVDPDTNVELATRADGDLGTLAHGLVTWVDGLLVGANTGFDLAVMVNEDPKLWPDVFHAIRSGWVSCVQVREKLLNLAQYGALEILELPDGTNARVVYTLAALVKNYLGIVVEGKEGDDAWRTNYAELEDLTIGEWPEDAINYSVWDAVYPTLVYRHQEDRRAALIHDLGIDPLATETFRVMVQFCLYLMSCEGVRVDPVEHAKIKVELEEALTPEKLALLVEEKILRPGAPAAPYKNGAKAHVEDCKGAARKTCECPVKMKAAVKPSVNKAELERFIRDLKKEHPDKVELVYTPTGAISASAGFMDDHYRLSPVLKQFRARAKTQKLVTTDMPRMEWPKGSGVPAKVLHACFDYLKETGRTSSFASKLYPSWNCQNPHPRVRAAIVAREGYCLYSVDYSGMELGTLAQKCLELFGHSVLADVINRGWDAHAYLGAQLAYYLDDPFHEACKDEGCTDPSDIYAAFTRCRNSPDEAVREFFAHYRKFAKPTGLGYPGGLGPETFVTYAHGTYGVECDVALAGELREVWYRAFPEMKLYHAWINDSCEDPLHTDKYAYTTPMGMYRAGASYCAAANGAGLQSPSAEGALLAVCAVAEATYADVASPLYTEDADPKHRPLLFIHDEIIGEARIDCAHEVAHEVSRIMVESMRLVTPDVAVKAEPVLMLRWSKSAEAVFENDRLIPWTPKDE